MILRPPIATRTTHSFPTRRSSDLRSPLPYSDFDALRLVSRRSPLARGIADRTRPSATPAPIRIEPVRSEEHTSELQSLMRISYAVFCLKKKTHTYNGTLHTIRLDLTTIQVQSMIHTNLLKP